MIFRWLKYLLEYFGFNTDLNKVSIKEPTITTLIWILAQVKYLMMY